VAGANVAVGAAPDADGASVGVSEKVLLGTPQPQPAAGAPVDRPQEPEIPQGLAPLAHGLQLLTQGLQLLTHGLQPVAQAVYGLA
jgi:hypothetical protein